METKIKFRKFSFAFVFFFTFNFIFPQEKISLPFPKWWEPAGIEVFKNAYPDIKFISSYDMKENDWLVHIIKKDSENKNVETSLYWCDSRFLPKEKIPEKDKYRRMIYRYVIEPPDPKNFSEEDIERIKSFSSPENRSSGPVDPPFLYDFIYNCKTRDEIESHIQKIEFLGFTVNVHERIIPNLRRVEQKINALPKTQELEDFRKSLVRVDCYNWRTVRDTENRSFHSVGIALDVLPRGYYQKSIYWGWQKQWNPDTWWETPLSSRWMPPEKVREVFRSEGFIWGGTWIVWDNMHFEYRPELLAN